MKHMRAVGALCAFLSIGGCYGTQDKPFEDIIDSESLAIAESIIQEQKKTLDDYFKVPTTNDLNIEIKGCGRNGDREFYYPDENEMELFVPRSYVFMSPKTTRELTRHGLGHYYADAYSEFIGNGSWPPQELNDLQSVSHRIVFEGIAEYFNRKGFDEVVRFSDEDWPKTGEEFIEIPSSSGIFYEGGYSLVQPILDEDVILGLQYLVTMSPNDYDLLDLPGYRQRGVDWIKEKK